MLKPNDVFTPGKPPVETTNVYASRGLCERDFFKAIDRSMVPVVFGEYGVGKTSMARHCLLEYANSGRLVNIESAHGKTLTDLLQRCLEHIGYSTVVSAKEKADTKKSVKGSAGFDAFKAVAVKGEAGVERSTGSEITREFTVTSPTDSKVIDLCEEHGLALLIDEMHRAPTELIEGLSSFIKAAYNKPCKRFKIALLGTSSDASRLVHRDPGIDRIVQEIHLDALVDEEARYIIEKGMSSLAIEITQPAVKKIIRASVGSPAVVQYLGLEVAEAAFSRKPRAATDADYRQALETYMRQRAERLNEKYIRAVESFGDKRYRKQILHAMAAIRDEYVTMEQLRDKVSELLDEEVPSTTLSGPLRALKTAEYGAVLKDVQHDGDERIYNYTAFADPGMKAFVRLRRVAEEEGIVSDKR